ncbi:hypothetical protein OROHE_009459 [Orobanche hederae]
MAMKPLTSEAIALTEKKMDMTLDDIIKMSQTHCMKPKKQRVSNKGQKFVNKVSQDDSLKVRRFMDTRSSIRQGALAQRRSNFQANQFPLATEAAKKAAVAPIRSRAFNQTRRFNVNKRIYFILIKAYASMRLEAYASSRPTETPQTCLTPLKHCSGWKVVDLMDFYFCVEVGASTVRKNVVNEGRFTVKKPAQVANGGPKQKPQTLDSLFATMKEERMRAISLQNNNGSRINGVVPWARGYQHN